MWKINFSFSSNNLNILYQIINLSSKQLNFKLIKTSKEVFIVVVPTFFKYLKTPYYYLSLSYYSSEEYFSLIAPPTLYFKDKYIKWEFNKIKK
jgi:hypothetical protein